MKIFPVLKWFQRENHENYIFIEVFLIIKKMYSKNKWINEVNLTKISSTRTSLCNVAISSLYNCIPNISFTHWLQNPDIFVFFGWVLPLHVGCEVTSMGRIFPQCELSASLCLSRWEYFPSVFVPNDPTSQLLSGNHTTCLCISTFHFSS